MRRAAKWLGWIVAGIIGIPLLLIAFVFVAATLPNLLLSPVAGAYVDRWNQRDVMIVSDLLRAALVLVIPVVAATNIYLVYPLIFAITSISIFFRPARVAILPRLVRGDELLTANSAMWAGETFADIIGYPLAGIFVVWSLAFCAYRPTGDAVCFVLTIFRESSQTHRSQNWN